MNRRNFLASLAAGVPQLARSATGVQPNILYIMADDHAAHAIGAYGSQINQTPNIDRIAREGLRLDNCFCTNSICTPSRAAILTGQYSHITGVKTLGDALDGSRQNVAKLLQPAGYQTAMIGKWHLKNDPTGFDYWKLGMCFTQVESSLGLIVRRTVLPSAFAVGASDEEGRRQDRPPHQVRQSGNYLSQAHTQLLEYSSGPRRVPRSHLHRHGPEEAAPGLLHGPHRRFQSGLAEAP